MVQDRLEGAGPPRGRWLLDEPDFRRLWLVGLVIFAVRWLEMLAVGVFVYQHTGSAFLVALMTLLRMVPMALSDGKPAAKKDGIFITYNSSEAVQSTVNEG